MAPFKVMYKGMQKMYITPTNSEGFLYLGGYLFIYNTATKVQWESQTNFSPFPCSQQLASRPSSGPDEFSPHALILSLYDPIKHHPPTYTLVIQNISIFKVFQSFVHMLYLSHAFEMHNSCHPSQPDHLNTK